MHIRASDGKIFYVGKGKGSRDNSRSGRSAHWRNTVAKHGLIIKRIFTEMSEDEAYQNEIEVIKLMREKGEKLCNIANGGNGGLSGIKLSAEHIEKLRAAKIGKPQTPDHARKSASAKLGKRQPRGAVERLAEKRSKAVINSEGEIFKSSCHAAASISERYGVRASQGNISMCARGERSNAYGYTWSYETDAVPDFLPTKYKKKKIYCSNGMSFDSVRDAQKWVKSWRHSASHQPISNAARSGVKAYNYYWEYRNEV